MGIPIAATEQYPKGLGPTVPELELEQFGVKAHPKSCFTMVLPHLMAELKEKQPWPRGSRPRRPSTSTASAMSSGSPSMQPL